MRTAGTADSTPEVDEKAREYATAAGDFDPAELTHGKIAANEPTFFLAVLPLAVVIIVNFLMSLVVLPRLDFSFLEEEAWGGITFQDVAGVWSVVLALAAGSLTVIIVNWRRLPDKRQSLDAGAIASVLPLLTVSSLVGFGLGGRCSARVRDGHRRSPLDSRGTARLADHRHERARRAHRHGLRRHGDRAQCAGRHVHDARRESTDINPELMHRITTMSAGTLDALPHNGTVLILLSLSGLTHKESYPDMVMTVIVTCLVALVAALILGSVFGSF